MTLYVPDFQVMGVLNVTPDSFSDGGHYTQLDAALMRARERVAAGADWLDIGGESTRPGAAEVSEQAELERVMPVLEAVRRELPVKVSVDTSKANVMRSAIAAGAGMINDVRALQEPGALQAISESDVRVCLMHMQGQPRTMQEQPSYSNVVADVKEFLSERLQACTEAGIRRERVVLDPGFGFGKSLDHNYQLLQQLESLHDLGRPLLVGISRKSMLGKITGRPTAERQAASVAAATIAAMKGAQYLRVHDVRETVDAVAVAKATLSAARTKKD